MSPKTSGKLNARFVKGSTQNKFDLPEETYNKVRTWRQKSGKPARSPRDVSPSTAGTVPKRSRTNMAGVPMAPPAEQRLPLPLAVGPTYSQAVWGGAKAYEDWFTSQFPHLGAAGQEIQTLTPLGKPRKAPVVGGRGNPLVQTPTAVAGRG